MMEQNTRSDISRYELSIVRAFAGAVRSAFVDYGFDICDFLQKVLKTEMFNNFEEEHTVYTQGAHCIAGKIMEQFTEKVKPADPTTIAGDAPVAYWMGYLLMYWKLYKGVGGDYLSKIDLEGVYWAYDAYHTVSIQNAIERIEEEFIRER